MPTGYTQGILNGQTFEQFVWSCCNAFIYDSHTYALPDMDQKPPAYYYEEHAKAVDALNDAGRWDESRWQREYAAAVAGRNTMLAEWDAERSKTRDLYQSMRARVADWTPPTPEHESLKKFMLDQIDMCASESEPVDASFWRIPAFDEWRAKHLQELRDTAERRGKGLREKLAAVNKANRWRRELVAVIPVPATLKPAE